MTSSILIKSNELLFAPKRVAPPIVAPAFVIVNFSTRADAQRDVRISQLVTKRETLIKNLVSIFGDRDLDPYEAKKKGGDYVRHKNLATQASRIVADQLQWPSEYSTKRTQKFKTLLTDEIDRWYDERLETFIKALATPTMTALLKDNRGRDVADSEILRREFVSAVLDRVRQSMTDSVNAMSTIVLEFTSDELADARIILYEYTAAKRQPPQFLVDLVRHYTVEAPITKGHSIARYLELFLSDLDIVERRIINEYQQELQRAVSSIDTSAATGTSTDSPAVDKLIEALLLELDDTDFEDASRELIFQYLLYANSSFPERYVARLQEMLNNEDMVEDALEFKARNDAIRNLLFGSQLASSPRITFKHMVAQANSTTSNDGTRDHYVDTRRHVRFATLFTQYSAARRVGATQPLSTDSFIVRPFTKIPGFRVSGRPLDQEGVEQRALAQSLERTDLQGTLFSMADVLMIRRRLLYDIEIIEDELETLIINKERSGVKQSTLIRLTSADFNGGETARVNIPIAIEVLDDTRLAGMTFFRARYYWNSVADDSQIFQHVFEYVSQSGTLVSATRVPIPRESGSLRIVVDLGNFVGAIFQPLPTEPPVHLPSVTFVVQGMCVRCRATVIFGTIPEGGSTTPCEWHINTAMFVDNQHALRISEKYYRIEGVLDEFVRRLVDYLSTKYIAVLATAVSELNDAIATGDISAYDKEDVLQRVLIPNIIDTIQKTWKISLFTASIVLSGTSNVLVHNLSLSLTMKSVTYSLSYSQLLSLIETFFSGVGRGGDPFLDEPIVTPRSVKPDSDADDTLVQHIVTVVRRLRENFDSYVADLSMVSHAASVKRGRGAQRLTLDLGHFVIHSASASTSGSSSNISQKVFGDDLLYDINSIQTTTYKALVDHFNRIGDRSGSTYGLPIITSRRQTFESIESNEDVFIPTRDQSSFKNLQQQLTKKRRRTTNFLVDERGLEEREIHLYSPANIFGKTNTTAYIGPHNSRSILPTLYRLEISRYLQPLDPLSGSTPNVFSTSSEARYQNAFDFVTEFEPMIPGNQELRLLDVYDKDRSHTDYDGVESFDVGIVTIIGDVVEVRWKISLYIPSNVRKCTLDQIVQSTTLLSRQFTAFHSADTSANFTEAQFKQLITMVNRINNNLVLSPGTKTSTVIAASSSSQQ